MAELRDSSLLFSLDSLLEHERRRVEDERAASERRRAEAEARRAAEAAEQALAEARRAEALRQESALAEARRREEEARLEGIRRAEIERATAEARLRGELELAAQKSEHELRVTALRAVNQARAVKVGLAAATLIALLAVSGALALEFGVRRPELRQLRATLDAELAGERKRTDHVQALLDASEQRAKKLEDALARAPVTISAPDATVKPASPAQPARPPARPPSSPRRPCTGNPDDPLNPCL